MVFRGVNLEAYVEISVWTFRFCYSCTTFRGRLLFHV
jgi:hypothetical protein